VNWPNDTRSAAYAPLILGSITEGNFEHRFVPIVIEANGHRGVFGVSEDALKIEGVRVNASAFLQQHVADLFGAFLLTPKLLDQMWSQRAVTVLPCPQPFNSLSVTMIAHSACVDRQLANVTVPEGGIIQSVCKTWVITNGLLAHPGRACNDGWHLEKPIPGVPFDPAPSLPGAHMIQSPGYHHDAQHVDYSQCMLFVARDCAVDGEITTFDAVAQNPELATLVNHDGILKVLRQPGSEFVTPPNVPPSGGKTVAMVTAGAGIGAIVGGPPGALVGATVGWGIDAVRRKMT